MASFLDTIGQGLGGFFNGLGTDVHNTLSSNPPAGFVKPAYADGISPVTPGAVPMPSGGTGYPQQNGNIQPVVGSQPNGGTPKPYVAPQNQQATKPYTANNNATTTPTNTNTNTSTSTNTNTNTGNTSTTGPGFAGTDSSNMGNLITNSENLAKQNAADAIAGYNSRFDAQKQNFMNELNQLGSQKDSVLKQIGDTFQNLINGVSATGQKNINQLNEQKDQTQSDYNNAGTDIRNTLQDSYRQNRQLARAMGDLDSSFYEGMQGNATNQAQKDANQLSTEEANNLNSIGNRISEVNTTVNNNISDINNQEANQKTQALQTYQQNYDAINNNLTLNEQDRQNAINDLNNQLSQTLNQIQTNFLNYKLQAFVSQYGPASLPTLNQISFQGPDSNAANSMLSNLQGMGTLNLPAISAPTNSYAYTTPQNGPVLNNMSFGNAQGNLNTNNSSPVGVGANANVTALPYDPNSPYNKPLP